MRKANRWVVKANMGLKGWKEINSFTNPAEADEWLCAYCRVNHFSITDFTIVVK
ncbi:MAG: hypothetical protein ACI4L5_05650 [Negativibacillus sp.]